MTLEDILFGKKYISIEIFSTNNEDRYAYIEAEQKKNEILICTQEVFSSFNQLQQKKFKPTTLIINNNQVLQKEIAGKDENDKKVIHQAFPNLKIEDFVYEIWRKKNSIIIGICRKTYIDQLYEQFGNKYDIVGLSFGVCSISSITGFSIPDKLYSNTQGIELTNDNKSISNINEELKENFNINGLSVPNTHLLPFCGILKLILRISKSEGTIADYNSSLVENFKQKSFFQKGMTVGIIVTISLLLINFFLFTYYFDNSQKLGADLALNSSSVEAIAHVKQRIANKEQKYKRFFTSNVSKSSLIINDIAKGLPSSILLTDFQYHPLEKKIRAQEPVVFNDNVINISGNTVSSEEFTAWISTVEKNKFVKEITITSFGKDNDNHTTFKIRINLK